jgi:hypothetical protein
MVKVEGKLKVLPITGHEGPKGEKRYSSTLPSTSALDGGWVINATPPGKTRYPLYRRLGGPPGTVWTGAENLASHRGSIPGPSSPYRVAIPTEPSRPSYLR